MVWPTSMWQGLVWWCRVVLLLGEGGGTQRARCRGGPPQQQHLVQGVAHVLMHVTDVHGPHVHHVRHRAMPGRAAHAFHVLMHVYSSL